MMSDSESVEKYRLDIIARGENEWSNFSVLDGDKKLVAQETGSFSVELPKGLYTVLKESGSSRSREIVILNKNKSISSKQIPVPSPDIREENRIKFSSIAQQQSRNIPEATPDSPSNFSPLFIFMNVDRENFKKSWFEIKERFEILDSDYLPISINSGWNVNIGEGWLSSHQLLEPGTYFLNYQGQENRTFPIELFKDNQTQVSLSFNEEPNFVDFQINLSPNFYYEPDDKGKKSFEIALRKLNYKDFNVSEKILHDLAYGKWKNPIYGLVVSYIYLKSHSHKYDKLFDAVVHNLEHRILASENSADLNLIKFLHTLHKKENPVNDNTSGNIPQFEDPPILRVGMETLIDLSYRYPDIIKRGSRVDLISDRLYYDIPWTSFKPFDRKPRFYDDIFDYIIVPHTERIDYVEISDDDYGDGGDFDDGSDYDEEGDIEESAEFEDSEASKIIEIPDSLLEILLPLVDIFHRKKLDENLSINFLARTLGIPPVSFERKIITLQNFLKEIEDAGAESAVKQIVSEKIDLETNPQSLKEILTTISRL